MASLSRLILAAWIGSALAAGALAQPYGKGGGFAGPYPGAYGDPGYYGGYGPSGAMSTHVPYFGATTFSITGADNGLGYEGSYVSAQTTFPLWSDPLCGWWLIDARANLSEQGEAFTNIGLARRKHFRPLHSDLGLGVFFDWDGDQYEDFGHDFYQVGISAHLWNPYFDVNFNGYIPVGKTDYTVGEPGVPFFRNFLLARNGFDSALRGYDVTFALRPDSLAQHSGTIYLGTYAYRSDTVDAFAGFHTMISIQPVTGVTLSAGLTTDEEFDTAGILQIELHRGTSRGYSPSGRDLDPFRRNAHIVRAHQAPLYVENPATGQRYHVVHVDNSADNNGDGTFEKPFNELADADGTLGAGSQPGDILFVRAGLSSDAGGNPANLTGYNTGVALLDDQLLLGDGIEYTLPAQFGLFTFSLNEDGILPTITNINGNGVTLANRNTVAGLSIQGFGSGNIGISDDGSGASDTFIDRVRVQGYSAPGGFGVRIVPSINTTIVDSTITGNDTDIFLNATNTTILNTTVGNSNVGIELNNVDGTTTLRNITAINPVGTAIIIGNQSAGSTTTITNARITSANGAGIVLNDNEGDVAIRGANIATGGIGVEIVNSNALVEGSTISSSDNSAIRVEHNNADPKEVTIQNNRLQGASDLSSPPAIELQGNGIGVPLIVNIFGNTVTAGTTTLFGRASPAGGGMEVSLVGNTFNSSFGLAIDLGGDVTIGTNFLSSTMNGTGGGFPPDTMGAVGPNHVVELIDARFAVYDKTGALLLSSTDEVFWINAGATGVGTGVGETLTSNPRLIYDPASDRWFAVAVGFGNPNTIFIARSNTNNPAGAWTSVQFVGDTGGTTFNDFATLGLNADGLNIATDNYDASGVLVDRSVYSIPKANLLAPVPTLANMTRREDLASIGTLQGVVDFGPSDGTAALFAAQTGGGDVIARRNLTGTTGPGAALSAAADIDVNPYTPAPGGNQPGPAQDLDNRPGDPAFTSHAVEVGDDIWLVHSVSDSTTGRSGIRWYQIDKPTNTVVQSGTISDPARDFLYPSIAVNNTGDVVIGMTGTGTGLRPSSMAVVGTTISGTTIFRPPTVLQAGVGSYSNLDANGRNRWGDYSATWVDPVAADRFWTFQERSAGTNNWGTQITEIILPSATNNVTVPVYLNNTIVNGGVILP